MSTFLELVSVLQTLDLKSRKTINSLHLRTSDGSLFQFVVDDAMLERLLAKVDLDGPELEASIPETAPGTDLSFGAEGAVPSEVAEPGTVAVFGGESPPVGYPPVIQAQNAPGIGHPVTRGRKQKPDMDDMGYPIVRGGQGKDPGEITANGVNQDEDGVPSL